MKPFEKLFVHLFTRGIEHYRDSGGTLKAIDDILLQDDAVLWERCLEAFKQAHRLNVLKKHGINVDIGSEVTGEVTEEMLAEIMKQPISLEALQKTIIKLIHKRDEGGNL